MGAWIEIELKQIDKKFSRVAPHMGAWIEIQWKRQCRIRMLTSHPTWVRGLKSFKALTLTSANVVAPHMGAWIEI